MGAEIITTDDLREFKLDLIEELKKLITEDDARMPKKWLKSPDVMKLLSISTGTLQNLRTSGALPYSKVGSVIFYDYSDIIEMMNSTKINNRF